jgi:hypothetical protein
MTDSDPNDDPPKSSPECFPEAHTERINVIISEIPIGAVVGELPVNYSAASERPSTPSDNNLSILEGPAPVRDNKSFECNTLNDEITCSSYAGGSSNFAELMAMEHNSSSSTATTSTSSHQEDPQN